MPWCAANGLLPGRDAPEPPGRGMPWCEANGLLPGREAPPAGRPPVAGRGAAAGRGAPGRGASGCASRRGCSTTSAWGAGCGWGADCGCGAATSGAGSRNSDGSRRAGAACAGAGSTGTATGASGSAGFRGPGREGAPVTVSAGAGLDGDGRWGRWIAGARPWEGVPPAGAPPAGVAGNDSRRRRTTGASTVDDADFTNSPSSLSFASTVLLSTPSSFASSWTRSFATDSPVSVRSEAGTDRQMCWQLIAGYSSGAHQLPTRFLGSWPSPARSCGDQPELIGDAVQPEPAPEGPVEAATSTCIFEAFAAGMQPSPSTRHRPGVHDDKVIAAHQANKVRAGITFLASHTGPHRWNMS